MTAHAQPATAYAERIAPEMVRIERLLPAGVDRVWSYLTRSDRRAEWLAGGEMELKVGGRVEHVFRNSELTRDDDPAPEKYTRQSGEFRMIGEITECEPMRLLAYTWDDDSEVRYELTPVGNQNSIGRHTQQVNEPRWFDRLFRRLAYAPGHSRRPPGRQGARRVLAHPHTA